MSVTFNFFILNNKQTSVKFSKMETQVNMSKYELADLCLCIVNKQSDICGTIKVMLVDMLQHRADYCTYGTVLYSANACQCFSGAEKLRSADDLRQRFCSAQI